MHNGSARLVVIEDEAQIRHFLQVTLANQGYETMDASTGAEGLRLAAAPGVDLVILDLGLPDLDGMEVLRRLRTLSMVPVLVLTVRDDTGTKVLALDTGADDYLTKPFGVAELLARVRVSLRRHALVGSSPLPAEYRNGDLRVDFLGRAVWRATHLVHLTPTEFQLLEALIHAHGRVLTYRRLAEALWGEEAGEERETLRVHIRQLRSKLEAESARPHYLLTEPGVGYKWRID